MRSSRNVGTFLRDLLKLAGAFALAVSLFSVPVMAQEDTGFGEWDADASGAVDENEWNEDFGDNAAFGEWDENDDDMLDQDEFSAGVFSTYDEDESGDLDEEEYSAFEEDEDDWF